MADRRLIARHAGLVTAEPAPLTRAAPHVRDSFNLARAMRCMVAALLPCLIVGLYNTGYQANVELVLAELESAPGWRGAVLDALGTGHAPGNFWAALAHGALYLLPVLAVTTLVASLWGQAFARLRRRPVTPGLMVIVLLFTLALPPVIPLWQAALGISFAVVFGREIFGGLGRYFLNPALTGLAFLYVTYPKSMAGGATWVVVDAFTEPTYLQTVQREGPEVVSWLPTPWLESLVGLVPGPFGTTSTLACLLGAALLLSWRLVSLRILMGILVGMVAMALLFNWVDPPPNAYYGLSWHWHLTLGGFAFGAVFLATDPTSAAATDRGRWIYGLFIGVMVVVMRVADPSHPDGVIFAILLGNVFAPLIDHLVVRANIRRRRRRGG